jgi:hypothetical protein
VGGFAYLAVILDACRTVKPIVQGHSIPREQYDCQIITRPVSHVHFHSFQGSEDSGSVGLLVMQVS